MFIAEAAAISEKEISFAEGEMFSVRSAAGKRVLQRQVWTCPFMQFGSASFNDIPHLMKLTIKRKERNTQ
jgi:hypothetical protein